MGGGCSDVNDAERLRLAGGSLFKQTKKKYACQIFIIEKLG